MSAENSTPSGASVRATPRLIEPLRIARLVRAFERGTLPRDGWTHRAHLEVALWYVLRRGVIAAIACMRAGIRAYNAACGVPDSDAGGYHETITVFFVRALGAFVERNRDARSAAELLRRLHAGPLACRSYVRRFYSAAGLDSPHARRSWLPPARRELPFSAG